MKKKALFVTDQLERIYSPACREAIGTLVELVAPPQSSRVLSETPELLRDVEVIFSGWGAPRLDEAFLEAAPRLELFLYGAGSVRGCVTDAFWRRGIVLSTARDANAIPVSEFALAQVLLCLKNTYHVSAAYRNARRKPTDTPQPPGPVGGVVGLVSLGVIARRLIERLLTFGVALVAYDPFLTDEDARRLGVESVSLEALFERAHVVSVHTPWLKETENLIRGHHLRRLEPYASFINTARGAVVNEPEMLDVLAHRPDLMAVLDVTWPEPPAPDSPLWTLPNVVLSPHIAGSMGPECHRQGRYMLEELKRYLTGEPLYWTLTEEAYTRTA